MTRPISDLSEEIADFEAGERAYRDGDDEKVINANSSFMSGYKNAWHENEGGKYERYGDNAADSAFENHCEQIYSEFRNRTTGPLRRKVKLQALAGLTVTYLLGIATAAILAMFILSPFLLDAEDVIAFWQGVLR